MADVGNPTRIAFCITDLDPGGAERAMVHLVTRLDRRRWEPEVFCLGAAGALADTLTKAKVPVTCFGATRPTHLGVLFQLRRALKRFRPAVLQTFLFHANIVGRLAGWMAGTPVCVSGIRVAEKRARWPLMLDRVTNRLVSANVCVSQGVADFTAKAGRLPLDKLTVIPNGVDSEVFRNAVPLDLTAMGLPAHSRAIVSVGRLDPQKGLIHLVEAAREIAPQRLDVHFLLVGDGPEREALTRRVSELGLSERVHFTGWRRDVPRILRSAFCLALPSLWEGMPNVVLEAMAAGLPVVATRVEGVSELVIAEETGLLVESGRAAPLAKALDGLLSDPDRAQAMGRRGQERAKAAFSWEKSAAEYEALYRRLLEGRGV